MKYKLDQVIYYMRDNKPHSAPILAVKEVQNARPNFACTKEQKEIFTPFGEAGIFYATCHGVVKEQDAYPSMAHMARAIYGA